MFNSQTNFSNNTEKKQKAIQWAKSEIQLFLLK